MISKYTLVYDITADLNGHLYPLYVEATSANVVIDFQDFFIPDEVKGSLIECRFLLFKPNGQLEDIGYKLATPGTVRTDLNLIPLRMIEKLRKKLEEK